MKKELWNALLAYYTGRHHWAVEQLDKAKTGERAEFYRYLQKYYEGELRKLQTFKNFDDI